MNARHLAVTFLLILILGLAITSRSTLTPTVGVDHVFYGNYSDFMSQEVAVGNFDGDADQDIVTTMMWDDPNTCGATEQPANACNVPGWSTWTATKSGQADKIICRFTTGLLQDWQRDYWINCGWALAPGPCGPCVYAEWQNENKGGAFIFDGGNWSSKPKDIDLRTITNADWTSPRIVDTSRATLEPGGGSHGPAKVFPGV